MSQFVLVTRSAVFHIWTNLNLLKQPIKRAYNSLGTCTPWCLVLVDVKHFFLI